MNILKNNDVRYFLFILSTALCATASFVVPEFLEHPASDFRSFLFVFFQTALQGVAIFFLLYAVGSNKYLFSVFFPVFVLLGTVVIYYRCAYKTALTPMLIDAVLHNDLRTSLDVVPATLILLLVLSLGVGIIFVRFRFKRIRSIHSMASFVLPVVLLFLLLQINGRIRNSVMLRYPYSVYFNFKEYNRLQAEIQESRINPGLDCMYEGPDSLLVVFVIGESLRADHLQLNGYERATTPKLEKRERLISYPNVYSPYTLTGRSVPHILTRADTAHWERAYTETSFVPIFKDCGFETYWLANQESADTYIAFMKECDSLIYVHPEKTVYSYDKWLDEDLLCHVDTILEKKTKRDLLILHTIGSHWYYNSHFSNEFEYFHPITQSKVVNQCTKEEMINSYDNTVLYTDFVLDELITRIEKENVVLIYLSDHGEALGEDGQWLHAIDAEACKNPACFIWYSESYEKSNREKVEALKKNSERAYNTDFLFHSILSAANISSEVIEDRLNVFTSDVDSCIYKTK